jgi:signal transduction histidine kinase
MQEKEFVDYRFYVSYIKKQNQVYKITLAKNQHIKEEFFENVLSIIGLILTLIIVVFIVANWFISKMIWKPFFKTLTQLKSYSISEHKKFVFDPSNIFEFNALNSVLSEMTNTIYQSYEKQKEFTENASHEMQTPIAILKGNIEMLMQSENLDERDMGYIEGIELGLTKLSRLNSTLLLLAKIENKQSQSRISVNLSNVIHQILEQFNDALEFRKIEVEITLPIDFEIHIDPILVEILFSNLIQNAIRHNIEGGKIFIHNLNKSVMILNSGKPLNFESSELYDRFKKSNDSIESTGLGLAIVKSILNSYGNTIEYFYENELHIFRINFL